MCLIKLIAEALAFILGSRYYCKRHANIRLGKIEILAMKEFHNILNLKKYLNGLEVLE